MIDLVQYHSPDHMEYGIDEIDGPPFAVLSNKAFWPCKGATVWLVGKGAAADPEIYLGGWMKVANVVKSDNPDFDYKYVGDEGAMCDPLPSVSSQPWYAELLTATGNFRFGLTELKKPSLVAALRKLCDEHVRKPRKRRKRSGRSR